MSGCRAAFQNNWFFHKVRNIGTANIQKLKFVSLPMLEFKLEGEFIPMIQLLKASQLVQSGGEAQIVVEAGLVKYNGTVDLRKRLKVRAGDIVEFKGQKIKVK